MSESKIDAVINYMRLMYDGRTQAGRDAKDARAELATLRARVAALEAENEMLSDAHHKAVVKSDALEAENAAQADELTNTRALLADAMAQHEIAQVKRAEHLAELLAYDDKYCPLCTWRGQVELVDGVCPQCDTNWPEVYRAGRDERAEAKRRIAALEKDAQSTRWIISFVIEAFDNRFDDEDQSVMITRIDQLRELLAAHPAPEPKDAAQAERIAALVQAVNDARGMMEFFRSLAVLDEMDAWLATYPAREPEDVTP